MATPAIPASTRFFAPEVSKCYFVPTIANINTPTRIELDAGEDLTGEIADLAGWLVSSGMISTPDMGSRFNSQVSGRTSVDSSSITFYASKTGADVREVLPRGTVGFIVFMDGGDVAAQPMDVFPVEVSSLGKVRSTGDQASQITVAFAITSEPAEDVDIPAAA